jgi:hypothetical protein
LISYLLAAFWLLYVQDGRGFTRSCNNDTSAMRDGCLS